MIRALLLVCVLGGAASADQHVLRIATIVPDGTAWAREFRAFAREIETATNGKTRIKYYFGGLAGDELQMLDRLRRDQLDGAISGGIICERLAPTFKVMRIPGLFQSQRENGYVLSRLKPDFDKEFLAAGFINLIESGVGADIMFTRKPVSNMNELRFTKLWNWDIDESLAPFLQAIGMHLMRAPLEEAARDYDEGKHDGFIAPAAVALSWQWTAQTKYYTNLNLSYVSGCFLIRSSVFDALPIDAQRALRGGAAKIRERIDEVMSELEAKLLGGVLQQHGLTPVPVSSTFVSEFFTAAHQARDKALDKLIPADLVYRVQALLADFRAAR